MSEVLVSSKDDIAQYIPQRQPIIMVDTLFSFDMEKVKATSGFTISGDNIFCNQGHFSPAGIIEHIAQTAALMAGYRASKHVEHRVPKVGFIGAVRNFIQHGRVYEGHQLKTTLETLHQFDNVSIVKAEVHCNGNLVAQGEMQIFEVNE